jgi:hypothetical protein
MATTYPRVGLDAKLEKAAEEHAQEDQPSSFAGFMARMAFPREEDRFDDAHLRHSVPERIMSGSLPDQPRDNPVDAAPGNAAPVVNLRSGRE